MLSVGLGKHYITIFDILTYRAICTIFRYFVCLLHCVVEKVIDNIYATDVPLGSLHNKLMTMNMKEIKLISIT